MKNRKGFISIEVVILGAILLTFALYMIASNTKLVGRSLNFYNNYVDTARENMRGQ